MSTLREEKVFTAAYQLTRARPEASTAAIVDAMWENGRGLSYAQTTRCLVRLVKEQRLVKTRRGYYRTWGP